MDLQALLAALKGGEIPTDTDPEAIIQAAIAQAGETAATGLKSKNAELLRQMKELKTVAGKVPEGFDPELWETLLQEHEEKKDAKLKAEERWEELKQQLVDQHTGELTQHQTTIKELEQALSAQLIDNALTSEITAAKGNAALLLPHLKNYLKMVKGDEGYSTMVVDDKGQQRYSLTNAGKEMAINELVNEFKTNDTFAAAFAASSGGGGAANRGGSNGVKNPFKKGTDFSYTEQAKMTKADPALASQMKAAAEST